MNNYLRYHLNVLEKCLGRASRLEKLPVSTSNLLRFAFISCFGKRCFDCFGKFFEKIQRKKIILGTRLKKKMKFSDFFLRIFLKNRIFLPRYSPKESCKKWFNCALWAMYLSVRNYEIEWEPFSALFYETVIFKQKRKNHFHEIFFVVWFDTYSYREIAIFARKEIYYYLEFLSFLT